ncbi:helix-turn-helix domain-containing protein [Frondihabitans australicus]|uniref:XRE family transcriptional regulator n=1 Tax=Frondihabitans australicus TaxID=386892 RepID=A0A495IJP5_9MICO|nr:helix-turn-helix domain-containing protein [Frondihabitans australicus]RKR76009.1 XRE family transcriptional regulator [Frondihabitans australicus]
MVHKHGPTAPQEAPVTAVDTSPPAAPATQAASGGAIDAQALSVGRRIRELRRARGLTLVQLAQAAELSHPFLSQLERGLARPSMVSLERIAKSLGSTQVELLAAIDDAREGSSPDASQPAVVFVGHDDGSRGAYGNDGARMLVHGSRKFLPFELRGDAREAGDYMTHAEDEFMHVVEGTVMVDLEGSEPRTLVAGDSLYYSGGTPHRWSAVDEAGYRLFIVKERPAAL